MELFRSWCVRSWHWLASCNASRWPRPFIYMYLHTPRNELVDPGSGAPNTGKDRRRCDSSMQKDKVKKKRVHDERATRQSGNRDVGRLQDARVDPALTCSRATLSPGVHGRTFFESRFNNYISQASLERAWLRGKIVG